jgi:hypothetical protein
VPDLASSRAHARRSWPGPLGLPAGPDRAAGVRGRRPPAPWLTGPTRIAGPPPGSTRQGSRPREPRPRHQAARPAPRGAASPVTGASRLRSWPRPDGRAPRRRAGVVLLRGPDALFVKKRDHFMALSFYREARHGHEEEGSRVRAGQSGAAPALPRGPSHPAPAFLRTRAERLLRRVGAPEAFVRSTNIPAGGTGRPGGSAEALSPGACLIRPRGRGPDGGGQARWAPSRTHPQGRARPRCGSLSPDGSQRAGRGRGRAAG